MPSNGTFPTIDTPLAAYLIHAGFAYLSINYSKRPDGKNQATFIFKDSDDLQKHVALYNSGKATINLALYEHAKSTLLDRITRGLP